MKFCTGVITFLLCFRSCTGHESVNAEDLLQKVVDILEYLVKERKEDASLLNEEISAKLEAMEMKLDQLQNKTAAPLVNPTCAPCPSTPCTHCPDGWMRFQGSCYLFVNEKRNFAQAKAYCISQGAHLVEVETEIENKFLRNRLLLLNDSSYWIGLTDIDTEGTFRWEYSNATVSYNDWSRSQPDNSGGTENCADFEQTYSYKWNDTRCNLLYNSICEK